MQVREPGIPIVTVRKRAVKERCQHVSSTAADISGSLSGQLTQLGRMDSSAPLVFMMASCLRTRWAVSCERLGC